MADPAYLTFDDGPDPEGTPQVLDALDRAQAQATFFALGRRALDHPRLIERILAAGHAVELHGFEHRSHESLTREQIEDDARQGLEVLTSLGARPTRWRPPYGAVSASSPSVAEELGLVLTGWSADPRDWSGTDSASMLAALQSALGAHTIVLLHDGVMVEEGHRKDAAWTTALIEPLVGVLRGRGCEPVPLPPVEVRSPQLAPTACELGPWPLPSIELRVVEESELDDRLRGEIGEFICDIYERKGASYLGRAWRTIPPAARVLALADNGLVGHVSVFFPRTQPALRLAGIGDLAVAPRARRRGIARALLREAVFQGWRRGADAQVAATEAVRSTLGRLAFSPVEDFSLYWIEDHACRRSPHWLLAEAEPLPRPLRLIDPDF